MFAPLSSSTRRTSGLPTLAARYRAVHPCYNTDTHGEGGGGGRREGEGGGGGMGVGMVVNGSRINGYNQRMNGFNGYIINGIRISTDHNRLISVLFTI